MGKKCSLLFKWDARTISEENIQIFSDIDALAVSMSEKLLRVCRRHTACRRHACFLLEKRVLPYQENALISPLNHERRVIEQSTS